jgi:cation:H+ antiporter
MTTGPRRAVQSTQWTRQLLAAAGCALVGVLVHLTSRLVPVQLDTIGLGIGVVGAAFLLGWAADAGEAVFSGGLVLAVIALVTVLPEFVIEVRFAYSQQTELVTANLTGATRLLLTGATALPLVVAFIARRRGAAAASLQLATARRLELGILLIAATFAIQIVAFGALTLVDGVILIALYILYARRIVGTSEEEPAILGVPAGLVSLPRRYRRPAIAALVVFAAAIVVTIANPFADALLASGTAMGMDPYYLIQSIVPMASEAPEFVVVAVLVANRRPAQGLAVFLASSVSQWTLAFGALPLAYLAGGGGSSIPMVAQEQTQVGFTIALTLFAVAALVTLRPEAVDAALVAGLVAMQLIYPTPLVHLAATFVLVVFAINLLFDRRRAVPPLFRAVFGLHRRSPEGPAVTRRRPSRG